MELELVRVIWVFIFFFFALILIFTWSKIAVISGKIKAITRVAENIEDLSKYRKPPGDAPEEDEEKPAPGR